MPYSTSHYFACYGYVILYIQIIFLAILFYAAKNNLNILKPFFGKKSLYLRYIK